MPHFIAEIHDCLLDNFFEAGYSKLFYQEQQTFTINKDNFL
jgi:hypothetical protein